MRRGEIIAPRGDPAAPLIDISHFFYGHIAAQDSAFHLSGDNGVGPVRAMITMVDEERRKARERVHPPVRVPRLALKIEGGRYREEDVRFVLSREGGVDLETIPTRFRRGPVVRRTDGVAVRFVSTQSLDMQVLANLWDEVTLQGRESEVTDCLRIIEPDVQSVHFLTGMFPYGFFGGKAGIVVGVPGPSDARLRIPLGSLGDGMHRLLALSTALITAADGYLFIDEIDTGLHYSIMSEMWAMVVRASEKYKVQVTATTHSWDCVKALSDFCERYPLRMQRVAIHKIDRQIEHSVPFRGSKLVQAVKGGVELR